MLLSGPAMPAAMSLTWGSLAETTMVLSPSLPLVPGKLVTKIQSGAFIHLKELLGDNIALRQRLEESTTQQSILSTMVGKPITPADVEHPFPTSVGVLYVLVHRRLVS